jgi:diphthine-ammonia ligase
MTRLGILISGGKDSLYSAFIGSYFKKVTCGICIRSKNDESYMFHTPSISFVKYQAKAMDMPLIIQETRGVKEEELHDLKTALIKAKKEQGIQGILTGAVASQYQASRIQNICFELELKCYNPLWQINQIKLLKDLLKYDFEVLIVGIFAFPFTQEMLGNHITKEVIKKLIDMKNKYQIHPAGEGGEIETMVLNCPLFKKRIRVDEFTKEMSGAYSGVFNITKSSFEEKNTSLTKYEHSSYYSLKKELSENHQVSIISCTSLDEPLLELEYLRPIIDLVAELGLTYRVIHVSKLSKEVEGTCAIISGTALWDDDFLNYKDVFSEWLKNKSKVFGICAGAQLIGLEYKEETVKCYKVGQDRVQSTSDNHFSSLVNNTSEFFLHKRSFLKKENSPLECLGFNNEYNSFFKIKNKDIYGSLFHSEVNNKILLRTFLEKVTKEDN